MFRTLLYAYINRLISCNSTPLVKFKLVVFSGLFLLRLASLGAQNTYLSVSEVASTYAVSAQARAANVGDHLLIYQFGGARVETQGPATGQVSDLRGAGHYALTSVARIRGDTLHFSQAVRGSFEAAFTQVVTDAGAPRRSVGDVEAPPFDGRVGGVVFLAASERLTVTGTIDAAAAGFRGGAGVQAPGSCNFLTQANELTYPSGNFRGSSRGEGVSSEVAARVLGRAPLANGGGGGNDHNTGGGGGANVSPGGIGAMNIVAGALLCRGLFPGYGGSALLPNVDRIYLGGGGGAGHANNTDAAAGGRGGGVVVLWAPEVIFAPGARVVANGADAKAISGDGAGGGGAGGTLVVYSTTLTGSPDINLSGGDGGNTQNLPDRCFGPGGGGGGGRMLLTGDQEGFAPVTDLGGGAPGQRMGSKLCGPTESIGTSGGDGETQRFEDTRPVSGFALSQSEICTLETLYLTDNSRGADSIFYRFGPNAAELALSIAGDQAAVTFAAGLSGTFYITQWLVVGSDTLAGDRKTLTVVGSPTADTLLIRESADSITLQLVGVRNVEEIIYSLGNGETISTTDTLLGYRYAEAGTYRPSAVLVNRRCGNTFLEGRTVNPTERVRAIILEKDPSGCAPLTIDPLDFSRGDYGARRWDFPGGTPETSSEEQPTVTYAKPGRYRATLTLTGGGGRADSVATITVNVFDTPVADFDYTADGTEVRFRNLSAGEETSRWAFGDGSESSERDPAHTYERAAAYTVTLVARGSYCSDTLRQDVVLEGTTPATDLRAAGISVFPNPTSGRVYVTGPATLTGLFDSRGRKLEVSGKTVDLTKEPAGLYLLGLRHHGRIYTVPIVRQ